MSHNAQRSILLLDAGASAFSELVCLSILAPRREVDAHSVSADAVRCEALLRSAAARIPRLRYVALARYEAVELDSDREVDYARNAAPWRWWKIVRDSKGVPERIVEIPAWEGERVREFVRAADGATMEAFGGKRTTHTGLSL